MEREREGGGEGKVGRGGEEESEVEERGKEGRGKGEERR